MDMSFCCLAEIEGISSISAIIEEAITAIGKKVAKVPAITFSTVVFHN
jgi:hypothetical protein